MGLTDNQKRTRRQGLSKIPRRLLYQICESVRQGNYIKTACKAAGVREGAFYEHLRKAKEDINAGTESDFTFFMDAVEMAKAEGEMNLLSEIRKGDKGWQAKSWILERTRNADFGQKQEVKQTVELQQPALPPNPPKSYDEWQKRRLRRSQETRQLEEMAVDAEVIEVEESKVIRQGNP